MVHIGYVCADAGVPVHGPAGSSVHLRSLVRALTRSGATTTVVAARRGDGDEVAVEEVHAGRIAARLSDRGRAPRELARALAGPAFARRLSQIHRRRPLDLIYERLSLWGTGGLEFALRHDVPYFLEVNAPLVEEASRHRGLVHREAAHAIEATLLEAADRVFAVSRPLAAHVTAAGAAADRIRLTPNAIDPELFVSLRRADRTALPLTIGFVGSLKPWHGIPVLLEAFDRVRARHDVRLVVVGQGPLMDEVVAARDHHGPDVVTIHGSVPHASVPPLLSAIDVAVAPYPEADIYFSPLKVVEAMAAGAAVVASRSGDLPEQIDDRVTGRLVPPGDPAALAETLLELAADPATARRLGEAARRRALGGRTWETVAATVLDELATVQAKRAMAEAGDAPRITG